MVLIDLDKDMLPCFADVAETGRFKKSPSHLKLPELPMRSLTLITAENRPNEARDVFISYLEAELNNLK